MKNSADQGGCYPPKAEFNNCFIVHSKYFPVLEGEELWATQRSLFLALVLELAWSSVEQFVLGFRLLLSLSLSLSLFVIVIVIVIIIVIIIIIMVLIIIIIIIIIITFAN